jgi:WD40 repeat protein
MSSFAGGGSQYRHAQLTVDAVHSSSSLPVRSAVNLDPAVVNAVAASDEFCAFIDESGQSIGLCEHETGNLVKRLRVGSEIRSLTFHLNGAGQLAVCAADGTCSLWQTSASDSSEDLTQADTLLKAEADKLLEAAFHPSAPALLASRGANSVQVWDQSRPESPLLTVPEQGSAANALSSLAWSYCGDCLLTADRGGVVATLDPRRSSAAAAATVAAHGRGLVRAVWANDSDYLLTTGANSVTRERECAVFDARALSTPVKRLRIGGAAGSGSILPLLDQGSNLLFLCGRGDTALKAYEFSPSSGALTALPATLQCTHGAVSYAMLPKRACDVAGAEVARVLRLVSSGVQAVRVQVPRRDKSVFPEELFPPYPAAEQSLSAETWLAGNDEAPRLAAITPRAQRTERVVTATAQQPVAVAAAAQPCSAESDVAAQQQQMSQQLTTTEQQRAEAVAAAEAATAAACASTAQWRVSSAQKFKHVYGKESSAAVTNLSPLLTTLDSPIMACSTEFIAVPYLGGGGPVFIAPLGVSQRAAAHCTDLLNGHKAPVRALDFSPFYSSVLASGADDGSIVLWTLPPGGVSGTLGVDSAAGVLPSSGHAVRCLQWHPRVQSLLLAAAADCTVRLYDAEAEAEVVCSALQHAVTTAGWNSSGQLVAAACRDGAVRLLDLRCCAADAAVTATTAAEHSGGARQLCCWWGRDSSSSSSSSSGASDAAAAQELIITTGTAAGGTQRQLRSWDPRSLAAPLATLTVDHGVGGALLPSVCAATGLIVLAGKGESQLRCYELVNGEPKLACTHRSSGATARLCGGAVVPPSAATLDLAGVEVARYLKLSESSVEEVRFVLPRSEELQQYFQDDIYQLLPAGAPATAVSAEQWLDSSSSSSSAAAADTDEQQQQQQLVSLQPAGMVPLSQRPPPAAAAEPSKAARFRAEIDQRAAQELSRQTEFDRLAALANQSAEFTPNLSMGTKHAPGQDAGSDSDWSD